MPEPNFAIAFTAEMVAAEACEVGDLLVYDSALGRWRVASAANRTSADAGAQAVAMSDYGGSLVGSVTYRNAGVLEASISGLEAAASKKLVRTSTAGRIERIDSFTPGDDVVGYAEPDGRVHLHFGLPWSLIAASGSIPGGSSGDVQVNNGGALDGVSPGTSGNVLTSNGSAWVSAAPDEGVTLPIDVGTAPYATGGELANVGVLAGAPLIDLPNLVGDGDNTNDANYQLIVQALDGSDAYPALALYANSDGSKDVLIGGRLDWNTGDPRPASVDIFADVAHYKCPETRWYTHSTADMLRLKCSSVATADATPATVANVVTSSFMGAGTIWVTGRAAGGKVAAFRFEYAWDGSLAEMIEPADLLPVFVRKTAAASAWDCSINASGDVQVTGAAATAIEWRAYVLGMKP